MLRLSNHELAIIGAFELNADVSIAEVAKQTGMQPHSVTYYFSKLRALEILGPRRASINTYQLGYLDFHFLFSLSTSNATKRDKLISWLKKCASVTWFAEIGGQYQFAMSIRALHAREALSLMKLIGEKFPGMIRDQQLSIVNSISSYGRRYLGGKVKKIKSLKNKLEGAVVDTIDKIIDEVDHQILSGLSKLNYSSERELARLLNLPFSTLRRRIALLEKNEILNGYYHHVDSFKLGYQAYKLLIFCRYHDGRFLQQLEEFSSSQENVVHYLESLGCWQAELVIEVGEAPQASQLANQIQDRFENQISCIHVIPIFRHLKSMPIPDWKDKIG